jgi:glyoxylate/hydroxypyruvate reductase
MAPLKMYVTRNVPEPGLSVLKAAKEFEVAQWASDDAVPQDELLKNVKGIDVLFCLLTDRIDKEVLDTAGPSLKVICTMSVGYEHIDLEECRKRNIAVGNTPVVSTEAVADFAITLLLAASRRIPEGIRAVKNGEWGTWVPMWLCGPEVAESTVGIIGLGRIGYSVAKRVRGFGVKRLVYQDVVEMPHAKDVEGEYVSMETLLTESDFIIACCNLTPETKHLFRKETFAKMKNTSVLVNVSRGGVVKLDDLYDALKTQEIRAAALDVTEPEPLPTDSPLLTLDNCIITPHIASATNEARYKMSKMTAENILAFLDGNKAPGPVVVPNQ